MGVRKGGHCHGLTGRQEAHSFASCYLVTVVSTGVGTSVSDRSGISLFVLAWTQTGRSPEGVQPDAGN